MNEGHGSFPTTQWTAVVQKALSGNEEHRETAWADLARGYWMPLYAFSRRLGHDRQDAEDLTQGFFAYLLRRGVLDSANRDLGTLRTFLLRVFQRYIGDVRDHDRALKRGGGLEFISIHADEAEDPSFAGLTTVESPEILFDRSWAHALLRGAMHELGASERDAGRGRTFEVLEPHLSPYAKVDDGYEGAAAALQMAPEAIRQTVSRLRKKYRDCLRDRIAATLRDPDDARIDEELHALKAALRP